MRVLLVAVLAVACGGESGVLFDDARLPSGGGAAAGAGETHGGSTAAGGGSAAGPAGSSSEEAGADGSPMTSGGSGSGGSGGAMVDQAGAGGAMVDPVGGQPAAGGSAGAGGSSSSGAPPMAGAGGKKPEEPEVPAACESCRNDHLFFCEVSTVHPGGACIRCSDDGIPGNDTSLDCDGPGPEHYVSKNDHDPGYGCETFVGFNGSCP